MTTASTRWRRQNSTFRRRCRGVRQFLNSFRRRHGERLCHRVQALRVPPKILPSLKPANRLVSWCRKSIIPSSHVCCFSENNSGIACCKRSQAIRCASVRHQAQAHSPPETPRSSKISRSHPCTSIFVFSLVWLLTDNSQSKQTQEWRHYCWYLSCGAWQRFGDRQWRGLELRGKPHHIPQNSAY